MHTARGFPFLLQLSVGPYVIGMRGIQRGWAGRVGRATCSCVSSRIAGEVVTGVSSTPDCILFALENSAAPPRQAPRQDTAGRERRDETGAPPRYRQPLHHSLSLAVLCSQPGLGRCNCFNWHQLALALSACLPHVSLSPPPTPYALSSSPRLLPQPTGVAMPALPVVGQPTLADSHANRMLAYYYSHLYSQLTATDSHLYSHHLLRTPNSE
jgi:hypothetical protein